MTPAYTLPHNDTISAAIALPVCQRRKIASAACLHALGNAPHERARPELILALSTIPPRAGADKLRDMLVRLPLQSRPPDAVIISAPHSFHRFPNARMNYSLFLREPVALLEGLRLFLGECEDAGPGTKLLCPLPRLLAEHDSLARRSGAWIVLIDDDVIYKVCASPAISRRAPPLPSRRLPDSLTFSQQPNLLMMPSTHLYKEWALAVLERAILNQPQRQAFSFDTFTLADADGRAVVAGSAEGLHVGQGHAMLAMRLDALDAASLVRFYRCLLDAEPRAFFHDDVWISWWLHERGVRLHKINVPIHMGDVHYRSSSFQSPGALVSRIDKEMGGGANASRAEWNDAGRTRRLLNKAMAALRMRMRSAGGGEPQQCAVS